MTGQDRSAQSRACPIPAIAKATRWVVKVLWIKEPYLEQILTGTKTVEVRVLAALWQIYPPEKGALGAIALELALPDDEAEEADKL